MNLTDMTVPQLREIAAELDISGRSKMRKADLVAVITRAQMDAKWEANQAQAESTASDHNPTDGQVAAVDLSALPLMVDFKPQRFYTVPANLETARIDVEHDKSGRAFFDMMTRTGFDRHVTAVRQGRFWVIEDRWNAEKDFRIRATTLGKLAKRWARKLDTWANDVRIVKTF